MISTWDIIEEHFGFMLVWGDLIYISFWYSIAGWYMADAVEDVSRKYITLILLVHVIGHYMFRTSNW
jgi:delta14-sterol reductase